MFAFSKCNWKIISRALMVSLDASTGLGTEVGSGIGAEVIRLV